jgi:hypothetical protein
MISAEFEALAKEAEFTREMLGSGATQIRKANYASQGVYFQAFTSLSTGIERIGKLCLMLDHALENDGRFPDLAYMQRKICHKISLIYAKCVAVVERRSMKMEFLERLDDPIHRAILNVLSGFARGDRYCNINLLAGKGDQTDPVEQWFRQVDQQISDTRVSAKREHRIRRNARLVGELLSPFTSIRHTAETGDDVTAVEDVSYLTGMYEAVAPWRQFYVLQIIRFWVELLYSLHDVANSTKHLVVPHFGEIFAIFYNPDSYLRTRKTWDRL